MAKWMLFIQTRNGQWLMAGQWPAGNSALDAARRLRVYGERAVAVEESALHLFRVAPGAEYTHEQAREDQSLLSHLYWRTPEADDAMPKGVV